MKKLAILFLLTTVLFSFAFGQISEKMTLEFDNLTGATTSKGDKLTTKLLFTTAASGSKELGPGTLGLSTEVTMGQTFNDGENYVFIDTLDVKPSYTLAAGPGNLGIYLDWVYYDPAPNTRFAPGVEYTGIAAGPVSLGVGVELRYGYTNSLTDMNGLDDLIVKITAGFDFGLNIIYKLGLNLGQEKGYVQKVPGGDSHLFTNIAYLDVNYQILDNLVGGVELDDTVAYVSDGKSKFKDNFFKGFMLKPYVKFTLDESLSFGAYIKLKNLGGSKDNFDSLGDHQADGIVLTPGVWVKYTF